MYSKNFNHYSETESIKSWIYDDIKNARKEMILHIGMCDSEMINYWKNIVEYFRNFVKNIRTLNTNKLKKDLQFGNDYEKYASRIVLDRLGERV
jgi:hypothetical protein